MPVAALNWYRFRNTHNIGGEFAALNVRLASTRSPVSGILKLLISTLLKNSNFIFFLF